MKRTLFLAGAFSVTLLASSQGQNSADDLRKLADRAEQELKAAKTDKPDPGVPAESYGAAMVAGLRFAFSSGDPQQIEAGLSQLAGLPVSEQLRQECNELAAKLRADREAANKAAIADVDAALKKAADAVRQAKTAADLDEIIATLGKLRDRHAIYQRSSPELTQAMQSADAALQFVTGWQDYLAELQSGNDQEARRALENLAARDSTAMLIPRSHLLALLHPAETSREAPGVAQSRSAAAELTEILQQIKTPDDLAGALVQLVKVDSSQNDVRLAIQALSKLSQAYSEFKAGLSTEVEVIVPQRGVYEPYQDLTASVRAQVLTLVLPRYLGLPPDVQPTRGEGPYEFLDRVATDAMAHDDYLLAAKARETQRLLREGRRYGGAEGSQAGLFVTARNQEIAQQYSLAVTSYEKALASPSDLVPPKVIGARLAEIKAAHPQEYQQGIDDFTSPPVQRFAYPPAYGRGFPPGAPGFNQPQATPPPSLVVPAAPPRPATSPAPSKP